jgi:hypothetical protein
MSSLRLFNVNSNTGEPIAYDGLREHRLSQLDAFQKRGFFIPFDAEHYACDLGKVLSLLLIGFLCTDKDFDAIA